MRPTLYDEPVEALHLRDEPETLADARTARARRPSDHHNGSASVPSAWRANGVKEDAGIISGEVRTRARAASIVRSRRTMKRSGSNSSAGGTIARRSAIRMASTDDASAPVRAGTSGTSTGTFQAAVGNAGAVPDPAEPGTVLATEQLMASLNGEAIAPLPAERGMVGPDPEGDGEAVSEQDVFDEYVYDKGEAGGDEDAEDAMAAIGSAFADLSTDVELDAGR